MRRSSQPDPLPDFLALPPLPQDLESEMAALGCALIGKSAAERVVELLSEPEFYLERHRTLFREIARMVAADLPVDVFSLPKEFQDRGELEAVGGLAYIGQLAETVPTAAHVDHYCRRVKGKAQLRRLQEAARETLAEIERGESDPDEIRRNAESRIFAVAETSERGGLQSVRSAVQQVVEQIGESCEGKREAPGIRTGLAPFDAFTLGLRAPELWCIAARPAMGKSVLGAQWAFRVAEQGKKAALFSLEMTREELTYRWVAMEAGIDLSRLLEGRGLTTKELQQVGRVGGYIGDLPLFVDEESNPTVLDIRARCRRLARQPGGPLGLIVVDYIHLMQGHTRTSERRDLELGSISKELKAIAKEFRCPVVMLSQLNRRVEMREDKRPMLADLRDSGGLEADADAVAFPFRPAYYRRKQQGEEETGEEELAEIIIAKRRNGKPGTVQVSFEGRFSRFSDPLRHRDADAPPAYQERRRWPDDDEV